IRHAVLPDLVQGLPAGGDGFRGHVPQGEAEAVSPDVPGGVTGRHLAQVLQGNSVVRQATRGPVEDGEGLGRLGMPVLEASVGDAAKVQLPAPPDRLDRIRGRPAALFQAVKRERPLLPGDYVGKLLNLKILGLLLELHDAARWLFVALARNCRSS